MSSKAKPEADLESRVGAVLKLAFQNIDPKELTHQESFTVRVGHERHEVDGKADWQKRGRADILVHHKGRPLAVLELKREGKSLTDDDVEQGQSYAALLTPRPPLVIVSNGSDTRVHDSSTGGKWSPDGDAEKAVAALLTNAVKVAAGNMRWAVEALLGRQTGVWVPAMRARTTELLRSMTDPIGSFGRQFAEGFLIPRKATSAILEALEAGMRFIVLEGMATSGKSSVLRELAILTEADDKFAVFMLKSDGGGLFQSLANQLGRQLEWNLSPYDIRNWLRRMSIDDDGPTLVLAVDDVEPNSDMIKDLHELAGLSNGGKVQVVLTSHQAESITKGTNRRTLTELGTEAKVIQLSEIDTAEFEAARQLLGKLRINLHASTVFVKDYRAPWMLRVIYEEARRHSRYQGGETLTLRLIPGSKFFNTVRRAHFGQHELQRGYRLLARSAIADVRVASQEFKLQRTNAFLIDRDSLSAEAREELKTLRAMAAVRLFRLPSGEDVVTPAVPSAFMAELADTVSIDLRMRQKSDPTEAAFWLNNLMSTIYLGDRIGAEALCCAALSEDGLNSDTVNALLSMKPTVEQLDNQVLALQLPGSGVTYFKIEGGKLWESNQNGDRIGEPADLDEEAGEMYVNATSWMMLGEFVLSAIANADAATMAMVPKLLVELGECPFPLLRQSEGDLPHGTHSFGGVTVLCADEAPAESLTAAMTELICSGWPGVDDWLRFGIGSKSLPLLNRMHMASIAALKRIENEDVLQSVNAINLQLHSALRTAMELANEPKMQKKSP